MLNRSDVKRILFDLFRTELARRQKDALAVFDEPIDELFPKMPMGVLQEGYKQAAIIFGYKSQPFSSLELMTDYAYASYLSNRQITFLTSGSTGIPKQCPHSSEMIWEETRGVAPLFKGIKRIVSLVPTNHLYGFTFTVILPHTLNVPVVRLPALPTQHWNVLLKSGDLVAGFPLFWNYWLRCGNRFPTGVHALSSTAPCKDEIIRGLFQAGLYQFTEIYGASETGAMAFRHQAGEPFELFPFWDTSVKEGKLRIKRQCNNTWISLPDEVQLVKDRFLIPLKRADACVQVAGINVYPKRVETILSEHPAVKACRVRLMRAEEGERLKAFIVLNEGYTSQHLGIIRTYLAGKLTVHEMPRTFTFGPELPVSQMGKDVDW